jgi:hypothetical protein
MAAIMRGTAAVVLLAFPLTGFANGWRSGSRSITAYYYPAPVVEVPVFHVMPVVPCPVVVLPPAPVLPVPAVPAPRPLATPTPAPPSSGPVVPTSPSTPPMSPVPAVEESRSFYPPAPGVTTTSKGPINDKAKVGFWNLSTREVVLRVDGQPHVLAQGQCLKLELGRRFVWQAGDYEAQIEDMPAGVPSMELVIRR